MLLGRGREQDRLGALLEGARRGSSGMLIVHGEPGIGKTALLESAVSRAAGFAKVRGQPLQSEAELPFAALSDLLRPLLHHLDRIPEPQAAVLSGSLALGPPAPADRFASGAATLSLLAAAAEEAPVLAAVDDAHWLDAPSRDALVFAGRRLQSEGVLVLLAMRDRPWLWEAGVERLELEGLAPDNARALVEGSGHQVAETVRDRLVAETGGNPLALIEALSALTPAQLGGAEAITAPIAVGHDLERSFAQRLEGLPMETQRALLVCAASDTGDSREIGRALAETGLETSTLDAAERHGLIEVGPDRLRFRHPLVRSAAYHHHDPAERRAAHRALASGLAPAEHDRIAWHLGSAAAGPDEEVAARLEAAGRSAEGRSGYAAAGRALERAAQLSPADGDRVRRTVAAGRAVWLGGEPLRAADLLRGILGLVSDPGQRGAIQRQRGGALVYCAPVEETYALVVEEASRVEPHDPESAVALLCIGSTCCWMAGRTERGLDVAARATRIAERVGGAVGVFAKTELATGLALRGRTAEARAILDPLLPVLRSTDPLSGGGATLVLGSAAMVWLDMWDEAFDLIVHVIDRARASGAIVALPVALTLLAELEVRRGRIATSYAAATESVQLAVDTGQIVDASHAFVTLARVAAVRGHEADCRRDTASALEIAARFGAGSIENYASSVLGILELGLGRADRAAAHLEECARLEVEHGLGMPTPVPFRADLVEAHALAGRPDTARAALAVLDRQASETGNRWAAASVLRGEGVLAPEGRYEEPFAEALDLYGDDMAFEHARTELCLGRRRRRSRRRADARAALRSALWAFDQMGAEPWAEQARKELRATGESAAPSPNRSLRDLTPQELQVALTVAQGATNKETAAALFLSPKTVEFHLGNVYRKLGVRSRTELVRKAEGLS